MGGLGHDFKAGVNWIHEPRLFATFNGGTAPQLHAQLDDAQRDRCATCTINGGAADVNIPIEPSTRSIIQDDWRVNDRLTLNLGLRYDYVDGMPIDQYAKPELRDAAGRRARRALRGHHGLRGLRAGSARKTATTASRASAWRGTSAATAATSFAPAGASTTTSATPTRTFSSPAIDATGGARSGVLRQQSERHPQVRTARSYRVGDPISTIASQNECRSASLPLFGQVAVAALEQPYTRQTNHRLVAPAR